MTIEVDVSKHQKLDDEPRDWDFQTATNIVLGVVATVALVLIFVGSLLGGAPGIADTREFHELKKNPELWGRFQRELRRFRA